MKSLNPYFDGKWSLTRTLVFFSLPVVGFNPCFSGRCSLIGIFAFTCGSTEGLS